jgi:hypothetical protein
MRVDVPGPERVQQQDARCSELLLQVGRVPDVIPPGLYQYPQIPPERFRDSKHPSVAKVEQLRGQSLISLMLIEPQKYGFSGI